MTDLCIACEEHPPFVTGMSLCRACLKAKVDADRAERAARTARYASGHRTTIPRGWRVNEAGRLVKCTKHLDVSTRLKVASSKRVRVGRRGRA